MAAVARWKRKGNEVMAVGDLVLVTEAEYRKAEVVFRGAEGIQFEAAPAEEQSLARLIAGRGVRVVVVGVQPYAGPLYEALGAGGGGLIARFGVGHDNVSKPLARQHGIRIANTPGVLDTSVAEHAMWLMGCLARKVSRLEATFRAGRFAGETGIELCGRTLGVLGFGNIGRRVAAMAHFGFGMRVIGADSRSAAEVQSREGRPIEAILAECGTEEYTTDVEQVFREADFLSVHLPVTPGTIRFVNGERLSWMKRGAAVVNTARGAVLDEVALYDALAEGALGGAALDVFEIEPYQPIQPDKDLRRFPNVVLTPHVGSNTAEANRRMGEACVENVRHFLAGKIDRLSLVE